MDEQQFLTTFYFDPGQVVGRQSQVDFIWKRLVEQNKTAGLILGAAAVGKTTVARLFASRFQDSGLGGVEVFSLPFFRGSPFPEPNPATKLVLFDNLELDAVPGPVHDILHYIDLHPDLKYLVISRTSDPLLERHTNFFLSIDNLTQDEAFNLLFRQLSQRLTKPMLQEIATMTMGSPYLINLLAHHMLDRHDVLSLNDIRNIIFKEFKRPGITDRFGNPIKSADPAITQIKNDIIIVSGNALDKYKRDPEAMYQLKPRQFEEFIAELMEKRGYTVDLTQQTRDGGKDLIMARHKDIGSFVYYVECKRYGPQNPVRVNLVRELAGTVSRDRVTAGLLITSSYFTKDAREFIKPIERQIGLVDFVMLKEWLREI